jgi:GT2 family glycosyltransferase
VIDVSFVVPTFRRPDALREVLLRLGALTYEHRRLEVIVVDDGQDDATRSVVASFQDGDLAVRYLGQPNAGAASARNHGASVARGDVLIFNDDDILVEPDHVERHLALREELGDCLANGDWVFSAPVVAGMRRSAFGRYRLALERRFRDEAFVGGELPGGRTEAATVSACNLAMGREAFAGLGGFDDAFPHAGAEDQDLSLRARREGLRLVRDRGIRLEHHDRHLSFAAYCRREENAARTAVVMARKHPDPYAKRAYIVANIGARAGDPWGLRARKAAKGLLARTRPLAVLHRIVAGAERLGVPDRAMAPLYRALIGLHTFRGVRFSLRPAEPWD